MSKIEIIAPPEKMPGVVEAAHIHPDIVLAGGVEETNIATGHIPGGHGWQKTLDLYTYLREPTYDPDELNERLREIVPDVEPSSMDYFRVHGEDRLDLGKLYFDDVIGSVTIKRSVQIIPDLKSFAPGELEDGWGQDTALPLRSRTWLRLFPDAESLARVFTEDKLPDFRIDLSEVQKGKKTELSDPLSAPEVQNALDSPTVRRIIADLEYTH